jgi:hypothetical protein
VFVMWIFLLVGMGLMIVVIFPRWPMGDAHVSVEALLYAVGCEVIICGFVVPAHELTWRWEELRVHVIWTMRR